MTTDPPQLDGLENLLELPGSPSTKDKLFVVDGDWWNTACLNWLPDRWDLYATGYKDAADLLVSHVREHGRRHDTLVYPVLFLYRQYLELAIKDLIRGASRLQDKGDDAPQTHRIDHLWRVCQKLLNDIAPGDSDEELKHIERLINEFSKIDPTSMAFRYPENKDGSPSLSGMTHINLQNVKDVIGKIALILGGAGCMIGEYTSWKAEMDRDYEAGHW